MAYIKLVSTVKGAVTISGSQLVGNHIEAASWIPGNTLRGAFAAHWQTNKNAQDKDNTFLDLFCRGKIVFHGLFPLPSDSDECTDFLENNYFPYRISLSTFSCKYQPWMDLRNKHNYINRVNSNSTKCIDCEAPIKQSRRHDFYYSCGTAERPVMKPIRQNRETYIYHGTDRITHRARNAALYSYTSIPDGEGFIGWLSGAEEDLKKLRKQLKSSFHAKTESNETLSIPLFIGKGKKRRGHLLTEIFPVQETLPFLVNNIQKNLQPITFSGKTGNTSSDNKNHKKIIIVLQTPAICRDDFFCFKNTLAASDIFSSDISHDLTNFIKNDDKEFSSTTLIEGWSGIHRLPRMPDYALSAGSTFVFTYNGHDADSDLNRKNYNEHSNEDNKSYVPSLINGEMNDNTLYEQLKNAVNRGIGERNLEGYGQFTINPPMVTS